MLSEEQKTRLRPRLVALQSTAGAMFVASTLAGTVIATLASWDELGDRLSMLPLIGAIFGMLMIGSAIVFPLVFAGEGIVGLATITFLFLFPFQSRFIRAVEKRLI